MSDPRPFLLAFDEMPPRGLADARTALKKALEG